MVLISLNVSIWIDFTTSLHITLASQGLLSRGESEHPECLLNRGGGEIVQNQDSLWWSCPKRDAHIEPASLHICSYTHMYIHTIHLSLYILKQTSVYLSFLKINHFGNIISNRWISTMCVFHSTRSVKWKVMKVFLYVIVTNSKFFLQRVCDFRGSWGWRRGISFAGIAATILQLF